MTPRRGEDKQHPAVKLFGGAARETSIPPETSDGNVRTELLRLMRLPVSELQKETDPRTSAGAALARILLKKAVLDEQQSAITEVMDRIEGKATKSAPNKPTNDALNEQLDLSLEDLNKLATEE